MAILGAELQVVHSDSGRMTEKLTRDMIEAARVIAESTGGVLDRSDEEPRPARCLSALADEIWGQTGGEIDGFVQSVGTAASLRGNGRGLAPPRRPTSRSSPSNRRNRRCCPAARPARTRSTASAPASSCRSGSDGSRIGSRRVSTEDATAMALRLAREEGLFAGTSTGGERHRGAAARGSSSVAARPSSRSCATPG